MKAARCDSEISKLPKKVCDVAIFAELGLFERLALAKVHGLTAIVGRDQLRKLFEQVFIQSRGKFKIKEKAKS
jgi:hypothetical protein